ncbi:MAG: hypothetical protein ACYDA6_10520, partial [Solirubrobacteraceae bacterium]
ATPASALSVQVVNDSGQAPQNVHLMLDNGSSSDGQLVNDVSKPLSQISDSTFSIESISAGRLYISYGAPVKNNEPNQAPTRYDKIELTDPGVANLTAVDFFAIPFDMQALDSSGATIGSALTYRCHTSTILQKLRALAPSAEVSSGGQFVRYLSPQLSPSSYPSMAPYVQSMVGQTIHIHDSFASQGHPTLALSYSGTFEADGSITLSGTITTPPGTTPVEGSTVHVDGSTLPLAIYTGDGAYTVGGAPADVAENNQYSVIYRDLVAGFALGYWGGRYGNDTSDWLGKPDFAAARSGAAPYATYDQYAAVIGEYSDAYGYSFNDLGPTPVTVPLEAAVATVRLTLDSDQGPSTPGCLGESTPVAPPASAAPGKTPAPLAGRVKVTIGSGVVTLDKRGRALLRLSCSGDPCNGELTLSRAYRVRARRPARRSGRRGRGHGRGTSSRRGRLIWRTVTVVFGRSEFSIAEGHSQSVWVTISRPARRRIHAARGHRLVVLVKAAVGPRPKPTVAGRRSVTLKSYAPARRRRRHRRHS